MHCYGIDHNVQLWCLTHIGHKSLIHILIISFGHKSLLFTYWPVCISPLVCPFYYLSIHRVPCQNFPTVAVLCIPSGSFSLLLCYTVSFFALPLHIFWGLVTVMVDSSGGSITKVLTESNWWVDCWWNEAWSPSLYTFHPPGWFYRRSFSVLRTQILRCVLHGLVRS